jgi:hypothetical protein
VDDEGGGLMQVDLQYDGFNITSGYLSVVELDGVWSTPDVRTSDADRARQHGQWAGVDLLGGRAITATLQATLDPAEINNLDDVQALLRPTGPERVLAITLPGFCGGNQVRALARVRRLAVPVDVERYQFGVPQIVVEFWATDPRFYDVNESTATATVQSPEGFGMTFDATFDLGFGGPLPAGVMTATNYGNFPAPWVIEIEGPVTNPRIENVTTGATLRFDGSVGGGEVLRIDSLARTVTLGGASRYSWLLPSSQWFDLEPGTVSGPGVTEVRLAAQSGSGNATLTYRSAWI